MHVVGQCAVVYCCCVVVNSLRVVGLVCAWVHACLHLCVCGSCNSALLRHARMGVSHLLWGKSPALPCPALPCPALPCPALLSLKGAKSLHIYSSINVILLRYRCAFALCMQCGEAVMVSIAASFLIKSAAIESFTQQMPTAPRPLSSPVGHSDLRKKYLMLRMHNPNCACS